MLAYSDEQLVLEALDDSHQAFGQLVKQYQYRVLRTIASIISDEEAAQDIAQETFLSAWSNLAKLKEQQKFGRWLNQIAISFSKRWLRDQRKHQENTVSFDESAVVLTQELRYQSEKLRQEIWDAIDELAEDYGEVVVLHYISGYSYKEIGEMLSVPVSTVRGRLQQARNQLRKEFLDMVAQLQLEIDSTVHKFLKERAKQNGVSVEGLIIRLIERYKRDIDKPEVSVRKIADHGDTGAPSPDGRYLSFTEWWSANLAVYDCVTGEERNLTDEGTWNGRKGIQWAGDSIWSPDGKQIAYAWSNVNQWELRIVGFDGSKPRVLYRNEEKNMPEHPNGISPCAWSQDGKYILTRFHRKTSPNELALEIVLVSVDDGSVRVLKSLKNPASHWYMDLYKMSLSPDGRYVVYDCSVEERKGLRDIFLLATDGSGEETPLEEHPADNYGPVWTPDGKSIVFISDRSGAYGAWLMQVDDGKPVGEPQLVKRDIGMARPVKGFTREGSLYYGLRVVSTDVYVATIDPATGEVLEPPTKAIRQFEGFNHSPAWSPDGKNLAYVSSRPSQGSRSGHRVALVIRSEETGEERELYPEVQQAHYLRWSPDGRSILSLGSGRALINMIDAQTGDVIPIVQPNRVDAARVWNFALSSDGKAIFYIREGGSIVTRDLETGKEKELCQADGGRGFAVSPDGQYLAFAKFAEGGKTLMMMPTEGGEPRELLCLQDTDTGKFAHLPEGSAFAWTADGRYVLFRKMMKQNSNLPRWLIELWRISAEGGEPQKLLEMEGLSSISVHPDGRRIAFYSRLGFWETWALESFLPGFTAAE